MPQIQFSSGNPVFDALVCVVAQNQLVAEEEIRRWHVAILESTEHEPGGLGYMPGDRTQSGNPVLDGLICVLDHNRELNDKQARALYSLLAELAKDEPGGFARPKERVACGKKFKPPRRGNPVSYP